MDGARDTQPAESVDVVVVGAGLAGLACALELTRAGLAVGVLEAADAVGGRVRTDAVDGYLLDRGFQTVAPAYPALDNALDLDELDVRTFARGVAVLHNGRVRRLLAEPTGAPATALSGVVPALDAVGLAGLSLRAALGPAAAVKHRVDRTTISELRAWGLSPDLVNRVLRPLLSGVFLEDRLDTSARVFTLVWRAFLRGGAGLPAGGMRRLPELIAARLPPGTVRTGAAVASVHPGFVTLRTRERVPARAVVVATDADTARALIPRLSPVRWHGVTTYWHATWALAEPPRTLLLDPRGGVLVNSVAVTSVAPEYAPAGTHLVASSVLGVPDDVTSVEARVRDRLALLYGTDEWEFLRAYPVSRALPAMPAPHPLRRDVRLGGGHYVCGDHRDTSSIQGALVSGRRTARAVLADLRGSAPRG